MALRDQLMRAVREYDVAKTGAIKANRGYLYGTANLAGLALATGEMSRQPINLFAGAQQTNGADLGFARPLTAAETNLVKPGQILTSQVFVMTGIGFIIEAFPEWEETPVPNLVATPPAIMQGLGSGCSVRFKRGSRDNYLAGVLEMYPAGEMGVVAGPVSQTLNNTSIGTPKLGDGGMLIWTDPDEWSVYTPNDTLNVTVQYEVPEALFLTLSGTATGEGNPALSRLRLRCIAFGYDVESVQN